MNEHTRMGIPLRPDENAVRERTVMSLVRAAIAVAHQSFDKTIRAPDYAKRTWGNLEARNVEAVTRAVSNPGMTTATGWAAELAHVSIQFIASLVPVSAGADLLNRGLQLRFDGLKSISIPTITLGQAAFIGEGKPIPVVQYQTAPGVKLEPHALKLISTLTWEMLEASDAENIIRAVLLEASALGLDAALFSANAGTTDAPAGLLNGITPMTASTISPLSDAVVVDLAALGGAIARVAGDDIVFIAAPEQALAIRLWLDDFDYPVLSSRALAEHTVVAVAANALVSGFAPMPEIDATREATVHWDTAPAEIVSSGGGVVSPTGSIFQGDKVGLRMRMPLAWALRAPPGSSAIAFMNSTAW
jgi:hypothetical protein